MGIGHKVEWGGSRSMVGGVGELQWQACESVRSSAAPHIAVLTLKKVRNPPYNSLCEH